MDETYEQDETYRPPLIRPVRPIPQEDEERRVRIKVWMGWALIITALLADLVELFGGYLSATIVAFIVGIIASFVFWVWFLILGVPYSSNTKRFMTTILVGLGEIIPGVDAIPFWFLWTVGMIVIVGMVRMEDKGEAPSISGGLAEGLGMILSTNILAPIAMPMGWVVAEANMVRRIVKKKVGVGQADWVKEKEMNQKIAENPERINEIMKKYKKRPELGRVVSMANLGAVASATKPNVLDLKNKIGEFKKAA